jgi:hypothetical protein
MLLKTGAGQKQLLLTSSILASDTKTFEPNGKMIYCLANY